jgi:hypothetical protein
MGASPQQIVGTLLLTIGVGFLLANLRIVYQLLRFGRLRSSALLTWPAASRPTRAWRWSWVSSSPSSSA